MRVFLLVCLCLLLHLSVAFSKVYRWVDPHGKVHFTDNPASIPPPHREQAAISPPDKRGVPMQRPQAAPVATRQPDASRGVVVPLERSGHSMLVRARLNGVIPATLLVDTGAALSMISTASARQLGLDLASAPVMPMQSVSGTFLAPLFKLHALTVGEATAYDVDVVVHDTPSRHQVGLLGMSFFDSFLVTISAASNTMRLTPLQHTPDMPLFDGKPGDWWRRKFNFYRQHIASIDSYLVTHTSSQLEKTRRYFQAELAALEKRARRASVPRHWGY